MMQEWIVTGLFFAAVAYLGRRAWSRWRGGEGTGCPGCKGCSTPQATPLITLERRRK